MRVCGSLPGLSRFGCRRECSPEINWTFQVGLSVRWRFYLGAEARVALYTTNNSISRMCATVAYETRGHLNLDWFPYVVV